MSDLLGADFDQLRKDAFAPFEEHMRGVAAAFERDTQAQLPVLDHTRGDIDESVEESVGPNRRETINILRGLAAITSGDTSRVLELSSRLEQVEAEVSDMAAFVPGAGHH